MKGTILRILGDKYFGFIRGEDEKEYFFHQSSLQNKKFNQSLVNSNVIFEPTETLKGLRAEEVYVDISE